MKKVLGLLLFAFVSCSNPQEQIQAQPIASDDLGKYYEVEKSDVDEVNVNMMIYVNDSSKIKDINDYLKSQFNPDKKKYMLVYYFNKKGIGKTYLNKQASDHVLSFLM